MRTRARHTHTHSRSAAHDAARQQLQIAASTLRQISLDAGQQPELLKAAADVEAIFDRLYLPPAKGAQ